MVDPTRFFAAPVDAGDDLPAEPSGLLLFAIALAGFVVVVFGGLWLTHAIVMAVVTGGQWQ